jgi:hypothetical protein
MIDRLRDDPEVVEALRKTEVGLASRQQALMLYGLLGLQVGVIMLFTGAQPVVEDVYGVWSRVWLGVPATVAGILVCSGALLNDRTWAGWWTSFIGANLLGAWGTLMALSYAAAATKTGVHFSYPWDPEVAPAETARLFVPFVYQTIAILTGLHVVTLHKLGRPRRR